MKKTKKAFSLILAMILVLVMSLIAFFLLEYMIPFSKNTKGIENTSKAYYQAESAVEQALRFVNITRHNPNEDYGAESGSTMPRASIAIGNNFSIKASGINLPEAGNGNSEYDKNYDIIRSGDPIQLDVGNGKITNFSDFKISFKVPDLNGDGNPETLSGGVLPIINWQLNSTTDSLNASGGIIKASQINDTPIPFDNNLKGITLTGTTEENFQTFYTNNCSAGNKCTLKLSVINKLELNSNNTPVPYLEWKITTGNSIPLRYTTIKTNGKSYGFQKELQVRIPQQTVNEAYDFAVFQ